MRKIKLVTLSTQLMVLYSKFLTNGAGPLMKISLVKCVCERKILTRVMFWLTKYSQNGSWPL